MKRIIALLITIFSIVFIANAKSETESVSPTRGVTVTRYVYGMDINGQNYYDVECTIKAGDGTWSDAVKIVVKKDNAVIYKHTFKKSYLYVFSDGQIQIGVPRPRWVVIWRSDVDGDFWGKINEKEGVY